MNLKKYILSGLSVAVLIPSLTFGMDQKDPVTQAANNNQAQHPQQQPQPPFANPIAQQQQADQKQKQDQAQIKADANVARTIAQEEHKVLDDAIARADAQAVRNLAQANNNRWTLKKIGATIFGCTVGAFSGYLTKRMWSDLHTGGILELPATVILWAATDHFAESIGGSGSLAEITMIASAILMPSKTYSLNSPITRIRTKLNTGWSGISVGGGAGGIIIV